MYWCHSLNSTRIFYGKVDTSRHDSSKIKGKTTWWKKIASLNKTLRSWKLSSILCYVSNSENQHFSGYISCTFRIVYIQLNILNSTLQRHHRNQLKSHISPTFKLLQAIDILKAWDTLRVCQKSTNIRKYPKILF